ncbi:MAG: hypothetical protein HYU51_19360 [Candidatus Rokubacteria bacterium]|nr:hypothetical protein [Candidatus Rokubacteria bacterium]
MRSAPGVRLVVLAVGLAALAGCVRYPTVLDVGGVRLRATTSSTSTTAVSRSTRRTVSIDTLAASATARWL